MYDDGIGEPDGETGGDDRVRWMGQVVCIYPCVFHMLIWIEFLSAYAEDHGLCPWMNA